MDTIVALATARGRAGVAVVRVSGPLAWEVCASLAGGIPAPRRASLRWLRAADGTVIDSALVLLFEAEASFTGERVAEFQIHGSPAVIDALIRACLAIEGLRAAEPGEFTRRAFEAGRLSLTEVEALADLLEAETEAQRRQALRILDGTSGAQVLAWREALLDGLALCEASIDFADEDVPADLSQEAMASIGPVRAAISAQLRNRRNAERIRDGFEVAIVGAVNAGKSTLLNTLAGREAAITSERAGTTRDVLEVRMDIEGLPVTLIDTAGLRDAEDEVEQIGIARGRQRAAAADLRIYLIGDEEPPAPQDPRDLVLRAKADLLGHDGLSARTGQGIPELLAAIAARLGGGEAESALFSRARQFDRLDRSGKALEAALAELSTPQPDWEIASEELRLAIRGLDGLIGRVDVEEVLGRIFSSFCIGK